MNVRNTYMTMSQPSFNVYFAYFLRDNLVLFKKLKIQKKVARTECTGKGKASHFMKIVRS